MASNQSAAFTLSRRFLASQVVCTGYQNTLIRLEMFHNEIMFVGLSLSILFLFIYLMTTMMIVLRRLEGRLMPYLMIASFLNVVQVISGLLGITMSHDHFKMFYVVLLASFPLCFCFLLMSYGLDFKRSADSQGNHNNFLKPYLLLSVLIAFLNVGHVGISMIWPFYALTGAFMLVPIFFWFCQPRWICLKDSRYLKTVEYTLLFGAFHCLLMSILSSFAAAPVFMIIHSLVLVMHHLLTVILPFFGVLNVENAVIPLNESMERGECRSNLNVSASMSTVPLPTESSTMKPPTFMLPRKSFEAVSSSTLMTMKTVMERPVVPPIAVALLPPRRIPDLVAKKEEMKKEEKRKEEFRKEDKKSLASPLSSLSLSTVTPTTPFSPALDLTLDDTLADPVLLEQFRNFCQSEFSVENLLFYEAVLNYEQLASTITEKSLLQECCSNLYDKFIRPAAIHEININENVRRSIDARLRKQEWLPEVFEEAKKQVYLLMLSWSFPRFVRTLTNKP